MSTTIQFVNRDEVVAAMPKTENPINVREDAIANEKGILELLQQISDARRDLRITKKNLSALEESLAGKPQSL